MSKRSMEDFMNGGKFNKTASADQTKPDYTTLLKQLSKVAEGEMAGESVAGSSAPVAEGEVSPAAATPVAVNPTAQAAIDSVTDPQMAMRGGNPDVQTAGMVPPPVQRSGVVIGDGAGTVTDPLTYGSQPSSVATAIANQPNASTPELKMANLSEEEVIGIKIANAIDQRLKDIQFEREFVEARLLLKEAGYLDHIKFNDEETFSKTAAQLFPTHEGNLEKLANLQPNQTITKNDIVMAARDYLEQIKIAEEGQIKGAEDASALMEALEDEKEDEGADEEDLEALEAALEAGDSNVSDEVANAVAVLKNAGYLK